MLMLRFFLMEELKKERKGEERILIPSPNVKTYDLSPEMSANKITEKLLKAIKSQKYDFIVVNYANLDMVGHTGVWKSALKAVETIDKSLGKLEQAILEIDGNMFNNCRSWKYRKYV